VRRACRTCGIPVAPDAPFGRCTNCIMLDPLLARRARTGHWSPWRDRAEQAAFRKMLMDRADGRCEFYDGFLRCDRTDDLKAHHTPGGGGMLLCQAHHRQIDPHVH
jgi:hypothetical protein